MQYYKEAICRLKKEASFSEFAKDPRTIGTAMGLLGGAGIGAAMAGEGSRVKGAVAGGAVGAGLGLGAGALLKRQPVQKLTAAQLKTLADADIKANYTQDGHKPYRDQEDVVKDAKETRRVKTIKTYKGDTSQPISGQQAEDKRGQLGRSPEEVEADEQRKKDTWRYVRNPTQMFPDAVTKSRWAEYLFGVHDQ